ncbi:MAG: right-handed parallel beta-helix repeat-containing protein [Bacteroidetes bacterium]|nr:right-handed parallel beta-helix repeat-containing protein [Bacteroidota bacterium]
MKTILFSLLVFGTISVQATIRTVNNNPAGLAQFSNLQSAINASASGDSIYVHGSVSNYGSAEITDKKLTIIGPGISPDKTTSVTAMVSFIGLYNMSTYNCNGSTFIGLHITSELRISWDGSYSAGFPVSGVKVIRNKFTDAGLSLLLGYPYGNPHMYDFYVEGNYFENSGLTGVSGGFYTNCTVINNVFTRNASQWYSRFIGGLNNCTNVVIDHNLFYSAATANRIVFWDAANNLTIKNNIFVNVDNRHTDQNNNTNITNCSFQNNLTYNCVDNTPWTFSSNINLGGNISNTDPQMGSQAAIVAGITNPLLDFSIASGPANNAGTDSKDLGVLFDETTTMNWAYGRNSRLPYIHSLNVLNSNVPAGGILNVQVNARKAK